MYRYNATGQRVYKKVGSQTPEYYILHGDQTVAVYQNGAVKYWNILANGVVGRRDAAGNKFYYLKDHLGSTRAAVNAAGTVKEALDYYPFGLLMPGRTYQSGSETKEKFTGKERDAETRLDYFGARYYRSERRPRWGSPALGRWMAVDPLGEQMPSWSAYNFAFNNPIRFLDIDGRKPGDFFDEKGNKLGTDGKEDGKIYVSRKGKKKDVKNAIKNKNFNVAKNLSVELPSAKARQEMGKAVERAGDPSFHEEGVLIVTTETGDQKVINADPGEPADPSVDPEANIDVYSVSDASQWEGVSGNGQLATFHTHPNGTRIKGNQTFGFSQPPSAQDIQNAARDPLPLNHFVLSKQENTVYIYNGSGILATFPLDKFVSLGN